MLRPRVTVVPDCAKTGANTDSFAARGLQDCACRPSCVGPGALMSTLPESAVPTAQLIAAMLEQRDGVSDVIFSPGKPPQVEAKGELIPLPFRGFEKLTTQQTLRIAE